MVQEVADACSWEQGREEAGFDAAEHNIHPVEAKMSGAVCHFSSSSLFPTSETKSLLESDQHTDYAPFALGGDRAPLRHLLSGCFWMQPAVRLRPQ